MQVTVIIRGGPLAGRTLALEPGQIAEAGRSSRAALSFPDDKEMSGYHLVFGCERDACRVRDLNSSSGTFVNGARVKETVLQEDDEVRAGSTTFTVRYSAQAGGSAAVRPAAPAAAATVSRTLPKPLASGPDLLALLGGHDPLFALLDAARDPMVLQLLRDSKEQYQSLYEGIEGEVLARYAPYLVRLPRAAPILGRLLREGWGTSWGVYLTCAKPFEEVRKHFRHFLLVKADDGRELYFRFYDPRVLRLFLPSCTPAEITEFFGPIEAFLMEAEQPVTLLKFTAGPHGA